MSAQSLTAGISGNVSADTNCQLFHFEKKFNDKSSEQISLNIVRKKIACLHSHLD